MPSKHQIKSSNRKTQQKAKRCWRRQNKLRTEKESTDESKIAEGDKSSKARKRFKGNKSSIGDRVIDDAFMFNFKVEHDGE